MSFRPRPFDQPTRKETKHSVDEELLVFGYSCKLYRNDRNAEMEDSGALLIPWMGDSSLMIDRYDIRNRLEDKAQFGIKPILPQRLSAEEEKLEEELDRERYLALDNDILDVELGAEEEEKRMYEGVAEEGTFHSVGFDYGRGKERAADEEEELVMVDQPQLPEYLPTSCVDFLEEGAQPYTPPEELDLPEGLITPVTQKIHSIIEKTAKFISLQGQQMEIVIKTKQKMNPHFSFLIAEDRLYRYYQWLLHCMSTGKYPSTTGPGASGDDQLKENREVDRPGKREEDTNRTVHGGKRATQEAVEEEESNSDSDSDDEGFELHPLLRASLSGKKATASAPPVKRVREEEPASATSSVGSFVSPVSSKAFRHIALSMNSAPALVPVTRTNGSQPCQQGHPVSTAQAAVPVPPSNHAPYAPPPYPVTAHSGSAPVYPAYGFPVYDMTTAYYQASHQYMTGPAVPASGPVPPPPDLQPIVIKTAEYVAKNGESFEKTVLEKHLDDPRFEFLSPWHRFHAYYKMKIEETRQRLLQQAPLMVPASYHQQEQQLQQLPPSLPVTSAPVGGVEEVPATTPSQQPDNMQRLSSDGAVSFKLASKPARVLVPRLDLGGDEEVEEEKGDNEDTSKNAVEQNGEREPEAKRPHLEPNSQFSDMLDNKVQEFLVTVKAMLH